MSLAQLRVSSLMTRDPVSVHKEQSLAVAGAMMAARGVRHLPVVHDGWVEGVLSHRDLHAAEASALEPGLDAPVGHVMARPAVTVTADQSALTAARLLRQHRIGCLPVVDDYGWLVGIVTTADLVRLLPRSAPDAPADVTRSGADHRLDQVMAALAARPSRTAAEVPVHYYMSSPVQTVGCDDGLLVAAARLRAHRISSLVVVDSGRMVGVVTRSDLGERQPGDETERVAARMTRGVVEVGPATAVAVACRIMIEREVHQVVVSDAGRPVGVLSRSDAVAAARDLRLADPVARWATQTVFVAEVDQPVRLVLDLLDRAELGSVLVMDGIFPVGVFGRRERIAIDPRDLDQPIEAVMSSRLVVLEAELPLHRAAARMVATGVELAAVRGPDDHLAVLTPSDVARALAGGGR
jgi:CBS domain-containing protein